MKPWLAPFFLALLVAAAAGSAAGPDGKSADPPICPSSRDADRWLELLESLARANASKQPRPTEGPCKGERIERPEHCTAAIAERLRTGDVHGAVGALRDRVRGRTKPGLRVNILFSEVLERLRDQQPSPEPSTLIEAAQRLAGTMAAKDCKTAVGLKVVRYWLWFGERDLARLALARTAEASELADTEDCIFGDRTSFAIHAALVDAQPVDPEDAALFPWSAGLLAALADARDGTLGERLVGVAMSAKWRPKDPKSLCLLAESARDGGNAALAEELYSRAVSAHRKAHEPEG